MDENNNETTIQNVKTQPNLEGMLGYCQIPNISQTFFVISTDTTMISEFRGTNLIYLH